MSSADRRESQKQEVRERVLSAAREILMAEGIDGLSMRKLAAKVGYTATNLYYHFKDKEAVLRALMEADCVALRKGLDRAACESDPIERLRVMGAAYVEFALGHPAHYRFLFLTPAQEVPQTASLRRGEPALDPYAFLRAAAEEGIAAGRFRPEYHDSDQLAQIIWAGVHGLVALHLVLGNDPWFDWRPAGPTSRLMIDGMLYGLTVTRPA